MDADQAREFLIPRVIAQAEREGRPLTTTELRILMLEDADLPNSHVTPEAKLASLISRTSEELREADREMWSQAFEILEAEGSYLSLLLIESRTVVDWARVRRTTFYVILITIALVYASRWVD
jgi:hypothetical protein